MAVKLIGDEPVRGADKMQDFDDLAVFRDSAAGGESDGGRHGDDHQDEQGRGQHDDGAGHDADPGGPDAVVVEIGLRGLLRQRGAARRYPPAAGRRHVDDNDARHRQNAEVEAGAEPRLKQLAPTSSAL